MRQRDLMLFGAQGTILSAVLGLALFSPRAGEPALLIPLTGQTVAQTLAFAEAQGAPLLTLDTTTGRLTVRPPATDTFMRAMAHGYLPIDAAASDCGATENRTTT